MKLARLALLLTVAVGAKGGDEKSLQGIQGLYVLIEPLTSEVERAGLHITDIRTDVELKLQLAGIYVLTEEESSKKAGSPYLYVNANVMLSRESQGVFHYSISCELDQVVTLTRDPSIITFASTWNVGGVGLVGANRLPDIRATVRDLVDQFINAYLSVNPKR